MGMRILACAEGATEVEMMKNTYMVAVAAALMAAPLVMAHNPAGTPKTYCEPQSEWNTHEYGAPATGMLLQGYEDGNPDDCDASGTDYKLVPVPGPCPEGYKDVGTVIIREPPPAVVYILCMKQGPLDYDGHAEYARGGAWILAESGDGLPTSGGSLNCFGDAAHHTYYGPVSVNDVALGAGATFTVAADTIDLSSGANGPCGDFESDVDSTCTGSCIVTFPPSIDGSYQVYVQGTQGHVIW